VAVVALVVLVDQLYQAQPYHMVAVAVVVVITFRMALTQLPVLLEDED
jgi:hypothetical protein